MSAALAVASLAGCARCEARETAGAEAAGAGCPSGGVAGRAPRTAGGIVVRAGTDRLERPRTVFGGLRIDAKVAPADTGGDLYVIEHTDHGPGGPPRHIHHAQDEWFYVLEGTYRLEVGNDTYDLRRGDAVIAPRGVPHVWAHVGDGVGRLLILFQPAGAMEGFLTALSTLGPAPSPDVMRPLFAAHGMTVVGGPLLGEPARKRSDP